MLVQQASFFPYQMHENSISRFERSYSREGVTVPLSVDLLAPVNQSESEQALRGKQEKSKHE